MWNMWQQNKELCLLMECKKNCKCRFCNIHERTQGLIDKNLLLDMNEKIKEVCKKDKSHVENLSE